MDISPISNYKQVLTTEMQGYMDDSSSSSQLLSNVSDSDKANALSDALYPKNKKRKPRKGWFVQSGSNIVLAIVRKTNFELLTSYMTS